jgi:hypothetical protein
MRWMRPGSVLMEVASWGLYLAVTPSHVGAEVDVLAYPCTGLWSIAASRGAGPTYKVPSCLVVIDRRRHLSMRGSFPGRSYLLESLSSSIPVLQDISHGKWFLPDGAYPLAASWWYLGMFPRFSDVGQQWHGFHTRGYDVRCAYVPTATSHCAGCLRPTLPKARSGPFLSTVGEPPSTFDWRPGSLPRVTGKRRTGGEIPSAHADHRVENWWWGSFYQD